MVNGPSEYKAKGMEGENQLASQSVSQSVSHSEKFVACFRPVPGQREQVQRVLGAGTPSLWTVRVHRHHEVRKL